MEDIIIGTNLLYEAQAQATLRSIYRTSKKAVRFRETCLAVVVVIARVRDEVLYTFFTAPSTPLHSCQTLVLANVRQATRPLRFPLACTLPLVVAWPLIEIREDPVDANSALHAKHTASRKEPA
jgi:hypothetical protein